MRRKLGGGLCVETGPCVFKLEPKFKLGGDLFVDSTPRVYLTCRHHLNQVVRLLRLL